MEAAGLTGYRAIPVKLHPPRGKTANQPWNYYWLLPVGPAYKINTRTFTGSEVPHLSEFLTSTLASYRSSSGGSSKGVWQR
jgi:hypothetical protein